MDGSEPDLLAPSSLPPAHRTKLRSVNPLERLNAKSKWRRDVGGIFPNEAAIARLVGASCSSNPTNAWQSLALGRCL